MSAGLGDDCRKRHQNDGKSDYREDKINDEHGYMLAFNNQRLIAQNKNANRVPITTSIVFHRSKIAGSTTEANATSPISELISANLST